MYLVDQKLAKAAKVAMSTVIRAKKGEKVLIFTNMHADGQAISSALFAAAQEAGAAPVVVTQPVKGSLDFAEYSVLAAIRSGPEVIISISKQKLGKDLWALKKPYLVKGKRIDSAFQYLIAAGKARSFWSPSVTVDMFCRTVPVDYNLMKRDCRAVAKVLDRAEGVRITTGKGMDLFIGLKGRKAKSDDGDFSKAGKGGNLPAGEVFISPALGKSKGTIVFDGSISTDGDAIVIKRPIVAEVRNGFVTAITGGPDAEKFAAAVQRGADRVASFVKEGKLQAKDSGAYVKNAFNLGELGIGLNRAARIIGNVLEDEKVFRTCHIAIGSNYDNDAPALIHFDGIIKEPTIVAILPGKKEKVLIDRGDLKV